jgi:hypothetical protein
MMHQRQSAADAFGSLNELFLGDAQGLQTATVSRRPPTLIPSMILFILDS